MNSNITITVPLLASTQIGHVVNQFKSPEAEERWGKETAEMAKLIVKRWKKIAKAVPTKEEAPKMIKKEQKEGTPSSAKPGTKPTTPTAAANAIPAAATLAAAALSPSIRGKVLLQLVTAYIALCSPKAATENASEKPEEGALTAIMGMRLEAKQELALSTATDVESAMSAAFPNYDKAYVEKARTLVFNLRKNRPLAAETMMNMVEGSELVKMSSTDLATSESRAEADRFSKEIDEARRLDWADKNAEKINEACGLEERTAANSLFTCGRCKSIKTTSSQKQTRSADEPMTIFVVCMNCGKRWRC
jgi:transcription elongation factor S-II